MKKFFIVCALFALSGFTNVTLEKAAYTLFDTKGNKTNYEQLLAEAKKADVILFGELHDNPVCHWLQLELTQDLYADKKGNLVLGAEMFEADDQVTINEYLAGMVSEKTFKDEVKLWNNFATDYKPLLDLAKTNKLKFIATNIPRRYANMVYSRGEAALDSIDPQAKKWIAPFPIKYDANLKCYKEIFENAGGHGGQNLPKSQAYKDATMAYFIHKNWTKGKVFLHYNGAYHSNNHQAIEWYLKQQNQNIKVMVISSTEQKDNVTLNEEAFDSGDFIICTPASLTKTYK
ncbi:MAG: ChaN family lipoprotein [Bacteroidetes bacterium]|nr:ChaN family lipoprotein [Bacteroidota bacterium]